MVNGSEKRTAKNQGHVTTAAAPIQPPPTHPGVHTPEGSEPGAGAIGAPRLPGPARRWVQGAHLLLPQRLWLGRRRRFVLVSVLFGTTINELLGKVLGLRSVPQVGPDVVLDLVRRVHFFQEGCKRWNWQSSRGG